MKRTFGYMSRGESVPEVITTLWNLSSTGLVHIKINRSKNSLYEERVFRIRIRNFLYGLRILP
jgi:hypothetical protein